MKNRFPIGGGISYHRTELRSCCAQVIPDSLKLVINLSRIRMTRAQVLGQRFRLLLSPNGATMAALPESRYASEFMLIWISLICLTLSVAFR
jgi:hypothetical protein